MEEKQLQKLLIERVASAVMSVAEEAESSGTTSRDVAEAVLKSFAVMLAMTTVEHSADPSRVMVVYAMALKDHTARLIREYGN